MALSKKSINKQKLIKLSVSSLILLTCLIFIYWFVSGRYKENTDNAYIKGEITSIASQATGYVKYLYIEDNQAVEKETPLIKIEDQEYQVKLLKGQAEVEEAAAQLEEAQQKIHTQKYQVDHAQALHAVAQTDYTLAQKDYQRQTQLYNKGVISVTAFDKAQVAFQKAAAQMDATQSAVTLAQENIHLIEATEKKAESLLKARKASLKVLELETNYTLISAPYKGLIANRSVQIGQYVRPGSILMQLVSLENLWVVANFKETQITNFKKGNKAKITIDAFPHVSLEGTLESIAPASGAEFSLIPPENATGNFIKIVQRIPVKIKLKELPPVWLVPGLSAEVTVYTK